ncbi:hypothetical protein D3C87_679590 [compost metagenome]
MLSKFNYSCGVSRNVGHELGKLEKLTTSYAPQNLKRSAPIFVLVNRKYKTLQTKISCPIESIWD